MRLTKVKIKGYKSIDNIEINLEKFGNKDSYTSFLLGINESGKSNILEAISMLKAQHDEITMNYNDIRNKVTKNKYIEITYYFDDIDNNEIQSQLLQKIKISEQLLKKIKLKDLHKEIWLDNDNETFNYLFDFTLEKMSLTGIYVYNNEDNNTWTISKKSDIPNELLDQYENLTDERLHEIVLASLKDYVKQLSINIIYWKPNEEYLLNEKIQLDNYNISLKNIPLINMFRLIGCKDYVEMKNQIVAALNDHEAKRELETELSSKTTKYIKSRWSDFKCKIDVRIENNYLNISVCDDNVANKFYKMRERSDGFKQFISFILSLSIDNAKGNLNNCLILIDEPEVHLHPSSIKWMRNELIKIGTNNYLIVATHSNFMIDTTTRNRHILVTKNKGLTSIKRLNELDNIYDDDILSEAFGINVLTDFLPERILLVEGRTDQVVLQATLNKINPANNISIFIGKGDNIKNNSQMMLDNNLKPICIVDDDKDGNKYKNAINQQTNEYQVAYTLRDIDKKLPNRCTIEDVYPLDIINKELNAFLESNGIEKIKLNSKAPIMKQIEDHIKEELGKKETEYDDIKSKKKRLTKNIKSLLSSYIIKDISNESTERLWNIAKYIMDKFSAVEKDTPED